jgi:aryl-alcohol dehydrogenase-like predicted oxidoreductase
MKFRKLGRTGLQISEIGLGCGGKFAYPETSEAEILRATNLALDSGVNFLIRAAIMVWGFQKRVLADY